jgi:hypothetical protein
MNIEVDEILSLVAYMILCIILLPLIIIGSVVEHVIRILRKEEYPL